MRKVERKRAESMAKAFLAAANPSNWDGKGEKPKSLDLRVTSFRLPDAKNVRLDISIEQDEGEWCHYCEVVDITNNCALEVLHGYGIDSYLNLADTILDLVG